MATTETPKTVTVSVPGVNIVTDSNVPTESLSSYYKDSSGVFVDTSEKTSEVIMFKWGSLQKPFRCQLCDMLFEDGSKLKEHIDKHLVNAEPSSKPFPCKICPKAFLSNKSLERHTQMHYGQVQKRCKFCYKVFANRENLEQHILTHNGQKPHKCPQCHEQFVYRQGLETHMATHTGVRPHVCTICEKGFNRKDILDRHMVIHQSKRKKYKCVECNKLFSHSFVLKRHTRAVHSEEFEASQCPVCHKIIKCKENLVRHMKIHTGERPFECKECQRRFTQKQHLIDHMVLHTGGTPHQCDFCEESFKHKRSLTRHLRKHIEHRPHLCPKCNMGFAEKTLLKKHMLKHSEKRYQCNTCQLLFKLKTSLKRHKLKVHNEEISDTELDIAECRDIEEVPESNKKTQAEKKKVVVVVVRKDGSNKYTTSTVDADGEAGDDNPIVVIENECDNMVEAKGLVNNVTVSSANNASGTTSIAEKISNQVAMKTEERMAAGQQFEDAMEEERSNIIQSLIEYAEREMRESAVQKTSESQTVESIAPRMLIENIAFQGSEVTELTGAQSDAEIRESTQSILEDQTGTVYLEEAETIEGDQSKTILLNSTDNQSGIELVPQDSEVAQQQIMILGPNDDTFNTHTIIIRHDEATNNIIIEQVPNK